LFGIGFIIKLLPENYGSALRVNLDPGVEAPNANMPRYKRNSAELTQAVPTSPEYFAPRWPPWAQADLSVEELDVRLVEARLLDPPRLVCVCANVCWQILATTNNLGEKVRMLHRLSELPNK
jgi:hypothetical protein